MKTLSEAIQVVVSEGEDQSSRLQGEFVQELWESREIRTCVHLILSHLEFPDHQEYRTLELVVMNGISLGVTIGVQMERQDQPDVLIHERLEPERPQDPKWFLSSPRELEGSERPRPNVLMKTLRWVGILVVSGLAVGWIMDWVRELMSK